MAEREQALAEAVDAGSFRLRVLAADHEGLDSVGAVAGAVDVDVAGGGGDVGLGEDDALVVGGAGGGADARPAHGSLCHGWHPHR